MSTGLEKQKGVSNCVPARVVLCEQAGWICYPPRTRVGLVEHHIWKDVEWGLHDEDWLGPRSRMRRGTCCSDRADVAR